jgi:hypothetical protein
MILQRLLAEAGAHGLGDELVAVDPRGIEVAADWASLKSPENSVGYERTEGFASPGGAALDQRRIYTAPAHARAPRWTPPGASHGVVVDDQGNGSVTEQRLHQLIRQPKPIIDRRFEIEFLSHGVEAACVHVRMTRKERKP